MAGDIRKTLEAEIMRWGERSPENLALHNPGSDPAPLRAAWVDRINTIRFTPDSGIPAEAHLPLARANLKTAARWSSLLNDIPPPGNFTWDPATRRVTIKRGTKPGGSDIGVGRVYISSSDGAAGEPIDDYPSPVFQPSDTAEQSRVIFAGQKVISARVYGPDIDGLPGWSALSVFQIP